MEPNHQGAMLPLAHEAHDNTTALGLDQYANLTSADVAGGGAAAAGGDGPPVPSSSTDDQSYGAYMNLMNGNGNGGATQQQQQQQQQQHSVGGMGIGQTPGFAGALPLRLSWAMCSSSASAAASSSSSAASATGSAADTSNHHHTRGDVAPPRFGHSCTVVDSALWGSELVVVYGGVGVATNGTNPTNPASVTRGDVRVYHVSSNTWFEPDVQQGPAPRARCFHAAAACGKYVLVFGGRHGRLRLADLWALDTDAWQWTCLFDDISMAANANRGATPPQRNVPAPCARDYTTLTSIGGGRALLFGGYCETRRWLADLWVLDCPFLKNDGLVIDGAEDVPLAVRAEEARARAGPTAPYLAPLCRWALVTNAPGAAPTNATIADLPPAPGMPPPPPPPPPPPANASYPAPRSAHAAALVQDRLLVLGGEGPNGALLNDLWAMRGVRGECPPTWTRLKIDGPVPSPRMGHTLTPLGGAALAVIGGLGDGGWISRKDVYLSDAIVLDRRKPCWVRPTIPVEATCDGGAGISAPSPRAHHTAVAIAGGRRVLVIGGATDDPSGIGGGPDSKVRISPDTWWLDCADPAEMPAGTAPAGSAPVAVRSAAAQGGGEADGSSPGTNGGSPGGFLGGILGSSLNNLTGGFAKLTTTSNAPSSSPAQPPPPQAAAAAAPARPTAAPSLDSEELNAALRASEQAARWEALRARLGMPRQATALASSPAPTVLTPPPTLVSLGAAWLSASEQAPPQASTNDSAPRSLCRSHAVRRLRELVTSSESHASWLTVGTLMGLLEDFKDVGVASVVSRRRQAAAAAAAASGGVGVSEEKDDSDKATDVVVDALEEGQKKANDDGSNFALADVTVPRFLHVSSTPWCLRVGDVDALLEEYRALIKS
ncbi:hypothetical protein PPROV_000956800 [Pycnococcus provasolii]|uniref:Galactose oxidase n=1 Tax=Pycnococcus provasolii TaxID=41880 RepID=A0A830I114_9CHLO|nr:hypothetical protein PPROV_000956800 [Pycnococcus provasolii]